jgi:hypothetical protein
MFPSDLVCCCMMLVSLGRGFLLVLMCDGEHT